jgi:hypothetical protein
VEAASCVRASAAALQSAPGEAPVTQVPSPKATYGMRGRTLVTAAVEPATRTLPTSLVWLSFGTAVRRGEDALSNPQAVL